MAEGLPGWQPDFEHGASFHGNWPECVAAEQALERFRGGQPCPERCGSIIRYRVGRPRQESVVLHIQDPLACRKHPEHRKAADVIERTTPRPRRRKCRRPRYASEDKALRYARMVLGEPERTAYRCTAHDPPVFHLHPKGHERTP